jgi:hypothetical protein
MAERGDSRERQAVTNEGRQVLRREIIIKFG